MTNYEWISSGVEGVTRESIPRAVSGVDNELTADFWAQGVLEGAHRAPSAHHLDSPPIQPVRPHRHSEAVGRGKQVTNRKLPRVMSSPYPLPTSPAWRHWPHGGLPSLRALRLLPSQRPSSAGHERLVQDKPCVMGITSSRSLCEGCAKWIQKACDQYGQWGPECQGLCEEPDLRREIEEWRRSVAVSTQSPLRESLTLPPIQPRPMTPTYDALANFAQGSFEDSLLWGSTPSPALPAAPEPSDKKDSATEDSGTEDTYVNQSDSEISSMPRARIDVQDLLNDEPFDPSKYIRSGKQ